MKALLHPIVWQNIADGVAHYTRAGFTYVEVPWVIPTRVVNATLPPHAVPCTVLTGPWFRGCLVGSAEQSLLAMCLEGRFGPGSYCAVSPCHRDDPNDDLHGNHFIKLELMRILPEAPRNHSTLIHEMVEAATVFHAPRVPVQSLAIDAHQVDLVTVPDAIEVGSYGYRSHRDIHWIYGTGVAEPRLSTVQGRARTA